jgi:hypothetical protein
VVLALLRVNMQPAPKTSDKTRIETTTNNQIFTFFGIKATFFNQFGEQGLLFKLYREKGTFSKFENAFCFEGYVLG